MIAQIRPAQLLAWLQSEPERGQPLVLDVREPSELGIARVHPQGFAVLSIPMGDIPGRLSELDPEQPIACLCHHGGRSMQVAAYLTAQGFTQVANIAGGIEAWSIEVDPNIPRY